MCERESCWEGLGESLSKRRKRKSPVCSHLLSQITHLPADTQSVRITEKCECVEKVRLYKTQTSRKEGVRPWEWERSCVCDRVCLCLPFSPALWPWPRWSLLLSYPPCYLERMRERKRESEVCVCVSHLSGCEDKVPFTVMSLCLLWFVLWLLSNLIKTPSLVPFLTHTHTPLLWWKLKLNLNSTQTMYKEST